MALLRHGLAAMVELEVVDNGLPEHGRTPRRHVPIMDWPDLYYTPPEKCGCELVTAERDIRDYPRCLRLSAGAETVAATLYAESTRVQEQPMVPYRTLPMNVRRAWEEIAIRLLMGLTAPNANHKPVDFLYDYASTIARASLRQVNR